MKFIIYILILSFTIVHTSVTIDSSSLRITDFEAEYFIDDSKKLTFEDVKFIEFSKGKNANSLGAKVTHSWIKIKLHNITDKSKKLF